MKAELKLMQSDNMKDCFKQLLEKLCERAVTEIPCDDATYFRGIAESMSVDKEQFFCRAVSIAIVGDEADFHIPSKGLASLELSALHPSCNMHAYVPLYIEHRSVFVDYINQNFDKLVERMESEFHSLVESLQKYDD